MKSASGARSGGRCGERPYRNIMHAKLWASHIPLYAFDQDLRLAPVDNSVPSLVSVPGIVDSVRLPIGVGVVEDATYCVKRSCFVRSARLTQILLETLQPLRHPDGLAFGIIIAPPGAGSFGFTKIFGKIGDFLSGIFAVVFGVLFDLDFLFTGVFDANHGIYGPTFEAYAARWTSVWILDILVRGAGFDSIGWSEIKEFFFFYASEEVIFIGQIPVLLLNFSTAQNFIIQVDIRRGSHLTRHLLKRVPDVQRGSPNLVDNFFPHNENLTEIIKDMMKKGEEVKVEEVNLSRLIDEVNSN